MRSRFVSSEQNPDIKHIKALRDRRSVRHAERLCVVEGPRFIADLAKHVYPILVVVRESQGDADLSHFDDVLIVPDSLFDRISDTTTPQGMLAIFPLPDVPMTDDVPPLLVIADAIQDPGNLGTIIRSAAALGATGVVCGPGTVDPYAPKVIRAAAASQWNIPVVRSLAFAEILTGIHLLVADGLAKKSVSEVDMTAPCAIAIGSEGAGVSKRLMSFPHSSMAIPMRAAVESLNAGIAASIILYEAQRQRFARSRC